MELTVSEWLYKRYPDWPEGELTRLRAASVCTRSFSSFAREAHFDKYIRLGKGEEQSGARKRHTLQEDTFEAFNGALYLDQGKDAVVKFLDQIVFPKIAAGEFSAASDHKTFLQEYLQKKGPVEIQYQLLDEEGPAHDRSFAVAVTVDGKRLAKGVGHSKKAAEQDAAKHALADLKHQGPSD
jgi:ribonuclease-3